MPGFWDNDEMWKDIITNIELKAEINENNSLLNEYIISLLADKANGDLGKNLFNPKTRTAGFLNGGGAIQNSDGYFELYSNEGNIVANIIGRNIMELIK